MKGAKLVFILLLIIGNWSAQAQNPTREQLEQAVEYARNQHHAAQDSVAPVSIMPADSLAQQILAYSAQFLGTPYRYAATGPKSFDCSGFITFVFSHFGYKLPHGSKDQIKEGQRVDKTEMRPGDLIFFTGRRAKGGAGHVGIVVENDRNGNIRFIHASTSRGVRYDELKSDYYAKRYLTGVRVY